MCETKAKEKEEEKVIDVIIPADSTKIGLRMMTQRTIDSLIASEPDMKFNIIVIDGNQNTVGFRGARTFTYDFPFNYHRCVNLGLSYGNSDVVAICNNDLVFDKFWLTKTLAAMGETYQSASPNNKTSTISGVLRGYDVARILLGWCIVIKRKVFDIIGKLDEVVNFWYSDNVYGEQLRRAGIEHILVLHARVTHLGSRTLRESKNKPIITMQQKKIFKDWVNKI
jgi:GT2 family glycosyltransferase